MVWYAMLWFMRRDLIRAAQRFWINRVPEHRRAKTWAAHCRQNRWARKYGLTILTVSFTIAYAMVVLTVAYSLAVAVVISGYFGPR